MKTLIALILLCAPTAFGFEFTNVFLGTTNNDGTGDTLRAAFGKINTNFFYLTNAAPTITQTNPVSGLLYTNLTSRPQTISVTVILTNAAVAGQCAASWKTSAQGGTLAEAATVGGQTLVTTLAETNKAVLFYGISPGIVYTLSNSITGAGNGIGIVPGSGQLITY